jgi:hypothetical protein
MSDVSTSREQWHGNVRKWRIRAAHLLAVLRIRIRIIYQGPDLLLGDPDPETTLLSTTKLTGRENLSKYTLWLGLVGPTDKEN